MSKKLFIGNIAWSTTEDELRTLFGEFGELEDLVIITDRMSGRSKGFGFVEMSSDKEAQAAIDTFNGKEIDGRKLTVNEARPREERPQGSYNRN